MKYRTIVAVQCQIQQICAMMRSFRRKQPGADGVLADLLEMLTGVAKPVFGPAEVPDCDTFITDVTVEHSVGDGTHTVVVVAPAEVAPASTYTCMFVKFPDGSLVLCKRCAIIANQRGWTRPLPTEQETS